MSEDITPALTKEQWERKDVQGNAEPWARINDSLDIYATRGGLDLWRDTDYEGCSGHHDRIDNPHGLAALCLYGQPFGFTHDDLRRLRDAPELYGGLQGSKLEKEWYAFLDSLAARIAALLPPEATP